MGSFFQFVTEINESIGVSLPSSWCRLSEIELAQKFLTKANEYFFQTYEDIGTTTFNGDELQYFSEFHKFWEEYHREIVNARINEVQAEIVAGCLHNAVESYGDDLLMVTQAIQELTPPAVAQVRFFTANQDFRKPPTDPYEKYFEDPTQFDALQIIHSPGEFLRQIGAQRLSQTDKRIDFARNAAKFLLDTGITAFEIAARFGNDAVQIRSALVNESNMGYGLKKANMFVRDMVELNVWPALVNFDRIDVASDINTMKLALRTRILQTDIPLLSSFLDVFCSQYAYIDDVSARAWRVVWEQWRRLHRATAPSSPCQMDYLLYRIGREYCKDNVVRYVCERGHTFYHFGRRLKNCPICSKMGARVRAHPGLSLLPCQIDPAELPREGGRLLLKDGQLLKRFDGVCIFENACRSKTKSFQALNPPQSISIKGQTGWTNSYAYRGRGGGGMMG